MPSPDDHRWAQMIGVDACQCIRCGLVASETAVAAGVGTPGPHGWTVGELSVALPPCGELDIDTEVARLLAGEFDDVQG